jgi:hypothetical protein
MYNTWEQGHESLLLTSRKLTNVEAREQWLVHRRCGGVMFWKERCSVGKELGKYLIGEHKRARTPGFELALQVFQVSNSFISI